MSDPQQLLGNSTSSNGDVIRALSDEGIQLFLEDSSVIDVTDGHHQKLSGNAAIRANALFRYAPQLVVDRIQSTAVQDAYQKAIEGTYRVKLNPGIHLGVSHKEAGAFSANMYDANGGAKGPAALFVNDATLDISQVPQYALNAFNVASFITGQYFMAEINQKLAIIQEGILKIEQILDIQQSSKLEAAIFTLQDMLNHREDIQKDNNRIQAALGKLYDLKEKAQVAIQECKKLIALKQRSINIKKDKEQAIETTVNDIAKYTARYQQAVQLYCVSVMLEVFLTNNNNIEELYQFKSEMHALVRDYLQNSSDYQAWISSYLNSVHAINKLSKLQGAGVVLSTAGGAFVGGKGGLLGRVFGALSGAAGSYAAMNEYRESKKQKLISQSQEHFRHISSASSVSLPLNHFSG